MLGLLKPTDPSWVKAVEQDLDRLLDDHAHCEMKAAQSALSIVGRWGGTYPALVEPLIALAKEEANHFVEVEARIRSRNSTLTSPRADEYVLALRAQAQRDGQDVPRLLDRLLVSALIEARSCERFKLLGEQLESEELRAFYLGLMKAEARHYRLFVSLAEACFGEATTRERLAILAEREGEIAYKLPLGATVHG